MVYPVDKNLVPDAWTRGKLDMFARVVEIQNEHPSWVDDAVIDELYKEVKYDCTIEKKKAVRVTGGEVITE